MSMNYQIKTKIIIDSGEGDACQGVWKARFIYSRYLLACALGVSDPSKGDFLEHRQRCREVEDPGIKLQSSVAVAPGQQAYVDLADL
jgi:hypothetical protein